MEARKIYLYYLSDSNILKNIVLNLKITFVRKCFVAFITIFSDISRNNQRSQCKIMAICENWKG